MKAFRPSVAWFFIYKRQVLINVGSAFSKPFVTHPSLVLKHEGHRTTLLAKRRYFRQQLISLVSRRNLRTAAGITPISTIINMA